MECVVAVSIISNGQRENPGIMTGLRADNSGWSSFMVDRWLSGAQRIFLNAGRG